MKRVLFIAFLFATVILFTTSAEAIMVTFDFSGRYVDKGGFTSTDFSGATITGYYTFDDTTSYANPLPYAEYYGAIKNLSGVVTYGSSSSLSFNLSSSSGDIYIANDDPGGSSIDNPILTDFYRVFVVQSFGLTDSLDSYIIQQFVITGWDSENPNSSLTSRDLPSVPPSFANPYIALLNFGGGDAIAFQISLDATPSNPVPEPGTMMLLGSGLVGLVGYGRRRFKK